MILTSTAASVTVQLVDDVNISDLLVTSWKTADVAIQFHSCFYLWHIFPGEAVVTFQHVPLRRDLVPEINGAVGDVRDVLSS